MSRFPFTKKHTEAANAPGRIWNFWNFWNCPWNFWGDFGVEEGYWS